MEICGNDIIDLQQTQIQIQTKIQRGGDIDYE